MDVHKAIVALEIAILFLITLFVLRGIYLGNKHFNDGE